MGITSAQELNDFGKVSFEALLKHFCAKKAPQKLFEISDKSAYSAVMAEFLTFKKIMWALVKSEKKYWFSSCMGHIKSNYGAQLLCILLMVYVF